MGMLDEEYSIPSNAGGSGPQESDSNFLGSAWESATSIFNNVGDSIENTLQESSYGKFLRKIGILDPVEAEEVDFDGASWAQNSARGDWRVRLSLPANFVTAAKESDMIMSKLIETNGVIFPYNPSINITNTAVYNTLSPTHSNYNFHAYQRSMVEAITINGEFIVETPVEGHYWLAAVHYFRSVTKMAYGNTPDIGSPPPVVRLNGYGDYVFNNVPVVVQSFSVELQPDIDYIFCQGYGTSGSYVPVKSNIFCSLLPTYSRKKIASKFSLEKFVNGQYLEGGFI